VIGYPRPLLYAGLDGPGRPLTTGYGTPIVPEALAAFARWPIVALPPTPLCDGRRDILAALVAARPKQKRYCYVMPISTWSYPDSADPAVYYVRFRRLAEQTGALRPDGHADLGVAGYVEGLLRIYGELLRMPEWHGLYMDGLPPRAPAGDDPMLWDRALHKFARGLRTLAGSKTLIANSGRGADNPCALHELNGWMREHFPWSWPGADWDAVMRAPTGGAMIDSYRKPRMNLLFAGHGEKAGGFVSEPWTAPDSQRALRFVAGSACLTDAASVYAPSDVPALGGQHDWWADEYLGCDADAPWLGEPTVPAYTQGALWCRRFSGGMVAVNAGDIELPLVVPRGRWRRLAGTVCPGVNDGSTVGKEVIVPPRDTAFLARG
jgi:hypothetical protein